VPAQPTPVSGKTVEVQNPPMARLSLFYVLYFALLGCIAPYWGLYLQNRDFAAEDIGLLMAGFGLVRVAAPNLWAALGPLFPSPVHMVRLAGSLTLLCFVFIWQADSFSSVLLVMLGYGFFWAAMLPQYEAITMRALGNQIGLYSRIRVWGSVGFIVLVLLAGYLFDLFSVALLPFIMLLLMSGIVLNSWLMPASTGHVREFHEGDGFLRIAGQGPVVLFILMTVLLQISHGPYYTFFSIYLESLSYQSWQIGLLWAVGVAAEVILFWQFRHLAERLSLKNWCVVSLLLTSIRWLLIALVPGSVVVLVMAQLMHAFSFGAMHVVAMRYVQMFFPAAMQGQGQALYSSIGFGMGSAIGAWLSGSLWNVLGGSEVFVLAGLVSVVALLLVTFIFRSETN
tara:strand:+ start:328 stop:1518 length:1191 start_codon:yes stop_codon:yes gene_type:complete